MALHAGDEDVWNQTLCAESEENFAVQTFDSCRRCFLVKQTLTFLRRRRQTAGNRRRKESSTCFAPIFGFAGLQECPGGGRFFFQHPNAWHACSLQSSAGADENVIRFASGTQGHPVLAVGLCFTGRTVKRLCDCGMPNVRSSDGLGRRVTGYGVIPYQGVWLVVVLTVMAGYAATTAAK